MRICFPESTPRRHTRRVIPGFLLIFLVTLLCSGCEGPAGPAGLPGEDGVEAPPVRDVTPYITAAVEAKTGGWGGMPWNVAVSGIDLTNDAEVAKLFRGVAGGIPGDDPIALDLSRCTGWGFCYNPGILPGDKARIVSVALPESVTELVDGNIVISGTTLLAVMSAFGGFSGLKAVRAPGLTYVGDYSFYQLPALETIDLPEVTVVGQYAFGMHGTLVSLQVSNDVLTRVDLPKAETIGEGAFQYYTALADIDLPAAVSIGASTFFAFGTTRPNTTLTTLYLPKAETIGDNAFQYYTAIETIDLPAAVSIGASAFAAPSTTISNAAAVTLNLPSAKTIGIQAFRYYTGITSIDLSSATDIGSYAFAAPSAVSSNTALTALSLPEVTNIGTYAFQYYKNLESISLPKIETIGSYAFATGSANPNTALTTLDLATVTSIGSRVFEYCTGLSSLKLGPTVPTLPSLSTTAGNGIFLQSASGAGSGGTITISVPADKKSDYETAGWKAIGEGATASGTINYGTNHKAITISTY